MWSLETVGSSVADCGGASGSCDPVSDLWVAFWAATTLNGLLPPGAPRDGGRLCHDRVEDLVGDVPDLGSSFSLAVEEEGKRMASDS